MTEKRARATFSEEQKKQLVELFNNGKPSINAHLIRAIGCIPANPVILNRRIPDCLPPRLRNRVRKDNPGVFNQ